MERSIFAAVIGGLLGITALGGMAFVGSIPGSTVTPSFRPESDWRLLDPVTYENISVFPVVSSYGQDTSPFLTLEEGLSTGEVIVSEQGQRHHQAPIGPRLAQQQDRHDVPPGRRWLRRGGSLEWQPAIGPRRRGRAFAHNRRGAHRLDTMITVAVAVISWARAPSTPSTSTPRLVVSRTGTSTSEPGPGIGSLRNSNSVRWRVCTWPLA